MRHLAEQNQQRVTTARAQLQVVPRILVASPALDGLRSFPDPVATAFKQAGCNVIYDYRPYRPQSIIVCALESGVHIVAISSLNTIETADVAEVVRGLDEAGATAQVVAIGKVASSETLEQAGAAFVYPISAGSVHEAVHGALELLPQR